jgi:hypothetical protein
MGRGSACGTTAGTARRKSGWRAPPGAAAPAVRSGGSSGPSTRIHNLPAAPRRAPGAVARRVSRGADSTRPRRQDGGPVDARWPLPRPPRPPGLSVSTQLPRSKELAGTRGAPGRFGPVTRVKPLRARRGGKPSAGARGLAPGSRLPPRRDAWAPDGVAAPRMRRSQTQGALPGPRNMPSAPWLSQGESPWPTSGLKFQTGNLDRGSARRTSAMPSLGPSRRAHYMPAYSVGSLSRRRRARGT